MWIERVRVAGVRFMTPVSVDVDQSVGAEGHVPVARLPPPPLTFKQGCSEGDGPRTVGLNMSSMANFCQSQNRFLQIGMIHGLALLDSPLKVLAGFGGSAEQRVSDPEQML